jgi:type IV secretion system protein VirB3
MRDPVFKGATRPAMIFGIPLLPLIIVGLLGVLGTLWCLQLLGPFSAFTMALLTVAVLVIMRLISKADDQKLNQMLLRMQSIPARRNRLYWGGHSSSPLDYRRKLQR